MSHVEPSAAFCSYCGYPPADRRRAGALRVCSRCHMGIVLRAAASAAPDPNEAFVIIDRDLVVQALSRRAERLLTVDEPSSFGVSLRQFLLDDGSHGADLASLVSRAMRGTVPSSALELRLTGQPAARFNARILRCGPPAAALLVLTPLRRHTRRSPLARGPGREKRSLAHAGAESSAA